MPSPACNHYFEAKSIIDLNTKQKDTLNICVQCGYCATVGGEFAHHHIYNICKGAVTIDGKLYYKVSCGEHLCKHAVATEIVGIQSHMCNHYFTSKSIIDMFKLQEDIINVCIYCGYCACIRDGYDHHHIYNIYYGQYIINDKLYYKVYCSESKCKHLIATETID